MSHPSSTTFASFPHDPTIPVRPFTVQTKASELDDLRQLISVSRIASPIFENTQTSQYFGLTREWIIHTRDYWLNQFNWWVERLSPKPITYNLFSNDWRMTGLTAIWEIWVYREIQEKRMNKIPMYLAQINDPNTSKEWIIHFTALFSTKTDAIPIIFSHGWPGCFLEFIPMLEWVQMEYTPETLP